MKVFVKVKSDGNVHTAFRFKNDEELKLNPISDEFIEITSHPLCNYILNTPEKFLCRNDVWEAKHQVVIEADKKNIQADGIEVANITVSNLPAWLNEISVDINGVSSTIPKEDGLDITSTVETNLTVRVVDPNVISYHILRINARAIDE